MAPNVPQDILDRLRALEQEVRQLKGRANIRPALNQVLAGDVVVGEGGTFKVITPGGQQVLYVGDILPAHPDATSQYGWVVRREDGSAAISVWTASGSGIQPIQIYDKSGTIILADDLVGGGLARPFLPTPMYPVGDTAQYASTMSTTPVSLWEGTHIWQHPRIYVGGYLQADAATTGSCQVYVDGAPWGAVHTVAAGGWVWWSDGPASLSGTYEQTMRVQLYVWVTSGAGAVRVCPDRLIGQQS